MTTLDHGTLETLRITTRPAIAERVFNRVVNAVRYWKNRRAFYQLGEMSDAELHDIGLTRADLSVVHSFGDDPTVRLGVIASARASQMEHAARMVG